MAKNKTPDASAKHPRPWPLTAAAILLACAAILADSKWRLTETEYTVVSSRLPAAFDGYRIVQLSDLHRMQFGEDNSRLVEKMRDLAPDLIALTGDFIEGDTQLSDMETLCRALTEIAPVCFVSGNHDAGSKRLIELNAALERCGVINLRNRFEPIVRGDAKIILCGVEDPNAWADMPKPNAVVRAMRDVYPDEFALFLGHRNDWPDKYPLLDVDLILSGHGHGGIIRLPFVGGVLGTNAELFPEYDAGEFRTRRYTMIVSRGLGDYAYIPRVFNPPEIPVITLKCEK